MPTTNKPKVVMIRNAAATDFGGGERIPIFIAKILEEQAGYELLVISRSKMLLEFAQTQGVAHKRGPWWSQQNWSGWRVVLTPLFIGWQIYLFFWYLLLFLRVRPTVVHPQGRDDFIAATFAGRLVGARVVWSDYADLKHVWLNVRTWYKNPTGKLVYLAALAAHSICVVSDCDKELILANLKPQSRVARKLVTIHNGVYDRYSNYADVKKDSSVVTYVSASRMVYDKGIRELIAAFLRLHAEHSNTLLLLMGDGPNREEFEKLVSPDDGIKLMGHVGEPLAEMAKSDVFVLPTYHEGFSIALIEAAMMHLAIVATNVGGNPELVTDGKTGLLVAVKDVDSLYEGLKKVYSDSVLREQLANQARDHFVHNLTLQKVVEKKFVPFYKGEELQ